MARAPRNTRNHFKAKQSKMVLVAEGQVITEKHTGCTAKYIFSYFPYHYPIRWPNQWPDYAKTLRARTKINLLSTPLTLPQAVFPKSGGVYNNLIPWII